MSNEAAMVCLPVEGIPQEVLEPGSIKEACSICTAPIWVSPTGVKFVRDMSGASKIHFVCAACASRQVGEEAMEAMRVALGIKQAHERCDCSICRQASVKHLN